MFVGCLQCFFFGGGEGGEISFLLENIFFAEPKKLKAE